ncbi:MAG: hypothetical protein K2R98_11710 [Gemmataceae bacterium]|nr:hypothetical protein [Gemmataceae bacterium]
MSNAPNNDRIGFRDRFAELLVEPFLRLFAWRQMGIWGFFVLAVLLLFGRHQVTPGREWVHLDWPAGVYYGLITAAGAVAGFLGGERRWLASTAGAVAAVGAFAAVAVILHNVPQLPLVDRLWIWVNVIALAVGLVPGVGLYWVADHLLTRPTAEVAEAKHKARLRRRRQARGLSNPE